MARIPMPDVDHLPEGPRREFVKALRRLYIEAGEPRRGMIASPHGGDRRESDYLSPDMVSRILKGSTLPNRRRLTALLRNLVVLTGNSATSLADVLQRINDTWLTAKLTEEGITSTLSLPGDQQPDPAHSPDVPIPGRANPMTNSETVADPVDIGRFKSLRRSVGLDVDRLVTASLQDQIRFQVDREIPLLTKAGWIPFEPLPLSAVRLTARPGFSRDFSLAKSRLAGYWPRVGGGVQPTYSAAVEHYDAPTNWFNGLSFRLVDVHPADRAVELGFSEGSYFEAFDTTEPLGFEAAMSYHSSHGATIMGPYRQWVQNPFELTSRCAVPGVNTLTIRRSRHDLTFYMHQRTSVATAVGTVHVVPAGEFQPSSKDEKQIYRELDLHATIIREYAEEFLGRSDVLSSEENETQVDFEARPEYAPLNRAIRQGQAQIHYLGLGMYPLTWKPEILLVCVFDDHQFDRIFANMVDEMIEGRLQVTKRLKGFRYGLPGKRGPYQGITFDERTVREYVDNPRTLPAGRACLALAWRHRDKLGLVRI